MRADDSTFRLTREQGPDGEPTLVLAGRLDAERMEQVLAEVGRSLEGLGSRRLVMELGGVDYLDSAGALTLTLAQQEAERAGAELVLRGLPRDAAAIKALINPRELARPPLIDEDRTLGLVEQAGQAAMDLLDDIKQMVTFLGEFMVTGLAILKRPGMMRWGDVALYMQRVGVDGLPIVGLISFLLGLIMAFMSSLQLSSFGANIFVASLVAVAMVRELGPIMTAVLVAGRSGSAFAAEIGTMVVNEEVDALRVMGYDPVAFLAMPKILAAAVVVPLLTLYSDLLAIMGGLLVGVLGLDLTVYGYVHQTAVSLDAWDVITGIIKSLVFAVIIAGVGCQRGFMVRGGAQAVGKATTSSVVTAMFLIIITDSVFAILLNYVC